jgi:hypothetical protein
MMARELEVAKLPDYLGFLCVQCPRCLRGRVFRPMSMVATMPLEEAARRLRCKRCGAHPKLYQARSQGDVRRWGGRD